MEIPVFNANSVDLHHSAVSDLHLGKCGLHQKLSTREKILSFKRCTPRMEANTVIIFILIYAPGGTAIYCCLNDSPNLGEMSPNLGENKIL